MSNVTLLRFRLRDPLGPRDLAWLELRDRVLGVQAHGGPESSEYTLVLSCPPQKVHELSFYHGLQSMPGYLCIEVRGGAVA